MSWRPGQLKHWLARNESGVWGDDPDGVDNTEVLRSTDINLDGSWNISEPAVRTLRPSDRRRKQLEAGDLVVVTSSGSEAHLGKTAIVTEVVASRRACFANFVQRLTVAPNGDPRYVRYLLSSQRTKEELAVLGNTTTGLRNLNGGILDSVTCPGPPIAEQRAIADYLDAETARIDALITKKQQLIHLLEERWRSLVDEVTAEGTPTRVRRFTSLRTSGPRGWASMVSRHGRPFVRSANLRRDSVDLDLDDLGRVETPDTAEAIRSMIHEGDTLVGITGANTGWVGQVGPDVSGGFVSQHVAILRPQNIAPRWLTYSIFAPRAQDQLLGGQYGGTKTQLGLAELADLTIHVPCWSVQAKLIALLEAKRSGRKRAASVLQTQVALLAERRQALITAAVTGEFKVPGAP